MIFSIHIPKTGGTSFRRLLATRYETRFVTYYGPTDPNTDARLQGTTQEELGAALPLLEEDGVEVLHGHLRAATLLPALQNPAFVWVWLRDPVERVISNYYYLREQGSERRAGKFRSGEVDLLAFAEQRRNANLQSHYLAPLAIEALGFVGLTERYDDCLRLLLGAEAPPRVKLRNQNRAKPQVSAGDRARIAELNAEDVALYARAKALVEERLAALPPVSSPVFRLRRLIGI